ncbi:MAG: hypothetical protein A2Y71_00310 [Bacteroidetes bacterium RBG_13_42_15]|nr:MAG: hypothetical protein A2Y71_00310 [Bacteroidetes bacterium RBG_13_42_15]
MYSGIVKKLIFPSLFMVQCILTIAQVPESFNYQVILPGKTRSDSHKWEERDIIENQILYNGRVWRNLYSRVRGNQFLFTEMFMPGTVSVSGKLFTGLELKYDIYNDELLIRSAQGIILQLNKEMVDGFTIEYNKRKYDFQKLEVNTDGPGEGYFNILYKGKSELLVKYKKGIQLLAVDDTYDLFNQYNRIYLNKDGEMHLINKKKNIINLFSGTNKDIMRFIKSRRLKVTRKDPDSFIPLVVFCDNLIDGN